MDREKISLLVQRHEGYRDKLYVDTVGVPTIGYGFNLDNAVPKVVLDFWFEIVLDEHEKALNVAVPWASSLDEVRYAVLVDMCYNLGPARLLQFKQTLAAVKRGDYDEASSLMLQSKWAQQVKGRAVRLSKMMRTGVWPQELDNAQQ